MKYLAVIVGAVILARPCAATPPTASTREYVVGFERHLKSFRSSYPATAGAVARLVHTELNPDSVFHQQLIGAIIQRLPLITNHPYTFQELSLAYIEALPEIQTMGRERFSQILQRASSYKAQAFAIQDDPQVQILRDDAADVQILHAFGLAHEADMALELAQAGQRSMVIAKGGAECLLRERNLPEIENPVELIVSQAQTYQLSHFAVKLLDRKISDVERARHFAGLLYGVPAEQSAFATNMAQFLVTLVERAQDPIARRQVVNLALDALLSQQRVGLQAWIARIVDSVIGSGDQNLLRMSRRRFNRQIGVYIVNIRPQPGWVDLMNTHLARFPKAN